MIKDQVIATQKEKISELKHQHTQLLPIIYGTKSEKIKPVPVDSKQLNMFVEQEISEKVATQVKGYTKTKKLSTGRQPLPDHLPEEDTSGMTKIGEIISKVLEYTPTSLFRLRYIRIKYADKNRIVIAMMPDLPLL